MENISFGLLGLEKHPYKISLGVKPECVGEPQSIFPEGWIPGCCFGAVSPSPYLLAVPLPCHGLPRSVRSGQVCGFNEDSAVFSLCRAEVWPHVYFTSQQSAVLLLTPGQMLAQGL